MKDIKICTLCFILASTVTLCSCGVNANEQIKETVDQKENTSNEILDSLNKSADELSAATSEALNAEQNKTVDLNSFNCSEAVKNSNWEDGIYQYFDMILPVGITYAELQQIVASSKIKFVDTAPNPVKNDETSISSVRFDFYQETENYSFSAVLFPPDLDKDSTIDANEWIVVGYSISRHYNFGGNDYAWFPGGYSINNQDWMPEDEEVFNEMLDDWGIIGYGDKSSEHLGSYAKMNIYFMFKNCKIGDYYFGVDIEASYQGDFKQFSAIMSLASRELKGGQLHRLRDILDGSADRYYLEGSSSNDEVVAVANDIYEINDSYNYEGSIGNVSKNENGDYNVLWSSLTVRSPKYIQATDIKTFCDGMMYQIYDSEPPYKCVEGDDSEYWYFIYEEYDNYAEAYRQGGTIYRVKKSPSGDKERVEYVFLEAFSSFEPAYDGKVLENVTTIMDKNATISYLVDYYESKDVPFEEIYDSNYTSIYYQNGDANSWRGFWDVNIDSIKNGKITGISERMAIG